MEKQTEKDDGLLAWYDANRRHLPWREDPSPYHVWISEIMLQQTRVETVRPYYLRFLEALPDISSLAAVPEDRLLKLWEGLGYYTRARNLQKGARQLMESYNGLLPESSPELQKITGIGPYTAAAIASIAFHERIPAIDGNLLRIFARLSAYAESISEAAAKKAASNYFLERMPSERPGDYNQALMDLGALVCLPKQSPRCGECPLSQGCLSRLAGRQSEFPLRLKKKSRPVKDITVLLIHDNARIAIRKRPSKTILAGLYEFPNTEGRLSRKEALSHARLLGFKPLSIQRLPSGKHVFSHLEWRMTAYEILVEGPGSETKGETMHKMVPPGELLNDYSIPSAFSIYRNIIRDRPFHRDDL